MKLVARLQLACGVSLACGVLLACSGEGPQSTSSMTATTPMGNNAGASAMEEPGVVITEPTDPDPGPATDPSSPMDTTTGPVAMDSGQTGSIGACGCSSDDECIATATDYVAALAEPISYERQYLGAQCIARDESDPQRCCFDQPNVCLCYYGWDGDAVPHFENAMVLGNRSTCDIESRGGGCVYPSSDFPGCDPQVGTSCDEICADADARVAEDLAKTFDAEVRSAFCDPESCICRQVIRIEDHCYAQLSAFATPQDCSLSDEEIRRLSSSYGNQL